MLGLTTAVVLPLIGRHDIWLLDYGDYPIGPHAQVPPSVYGFAPGLTSRAPIDVALVWLFSAVRWPVVHLFPFLALAPLACVGFAKLVGERTSAVAAATTLYVINPFIYERMVNGQVYFVLGYALLPLLCALVLAPPRPGRRRASTAIAAGLVFTLAVALAVHFVFIAGLALLLAAATQALRRDWGGVAVALGALAVGLVGCTYWLVPGALVQFGQPSPIGAADLAAFRTLGDPRFGLYVNVAGLYGFWRGGAPLAKQWLSGWPLLLALVWFVAALGGLRTVREHRGRGLMLFAVLACAAGFALALGDQGPFAAAYTWAFDHVPGFKVLREPQKFSALVALGYAIAFGLGVPYVVDLAKGRSGRVALAAAALALPCLYGFTELWGFAGYVRPGAYPASWSQADELMAPGATALVLPWHAYLAFPFTEGRAVANPMASFFDRPVVAAADTGAGSGDVFTGASSAVSSYLDFCLAEGADTTEFGRLLAPLGISYVVLAKVDDWEDDAWLDDQADLEVVHNWGDLVVFRNTEVVAQGYAPTATVTVDNYSSLVALSMRTKLTAYRVVVRHLGPGPVVVPKLPGPAVVHPIEVASDHATAVTFTTSRRSSTVVLATAYAPTWHVGRRIGSAALGAVVSFEHLPRATTLTARYGRWAVVRAADLIGALVLLVLVALLVTDRVRSARAARAPPQAR